MDHKAKTLEYMSRMKEQGVPLSLAAPPFYRLAWLFGSKVPPPLFQSFEERRATLRWLLFVGWSASWIILSIIFYQAFIIAPPLLLFLVLIIIGGWGFASSTSRKIAARQDKLYAELGDLKLGTWDVRETKDT